MLKNIQELVQNKVIDEETAGRIQDYYASKKDTSGNKVVIVFALLGAILVGLGILLLVAHNWDSFSITIKSVFAFLPVLAGQIACFYTLFERKDSIAWKESSTVFLYFALGAAIALISQIYHLEGDQESFILTWMLLVFPLVYLMKSSITSILYIGGITYYGSITGYGMHTGWNHILFWALLAGVLWYYRSLIKTKPDSLFTYLHHWAIPAAIIINLGTFASDNGYWMFAAYLALFGSLMQIGRYFGLKELPSLANGYNLSGWAGSLVLLITLSFEQLWSGEFNKEHSNPDYYNNAEFFISVLLVGILLFFLLRNFGRDAKHPLYWSAVVVFILFLTKADSTISAVVINLFVFGTGIFMILENLKKYNLLGLNLGLAMIAILVLCRFFDTNIPFVIRSLLFLILGTGFFVANYYMVKLKKAGHHE